MLHATLVFSPLVILKYSHSLIIQQTSAFIIVNLYTLFPHLLKIFLLGLSLNSFPPCNLCNVAWQFSYVCVKKKKPHTRIGLVSWLLGLQTCAFSDGSCPVLHQCFFFSNKKKTETWLSCSPVLLLLLEESILHVKTASRIARHQEALPGWKWHAELQDAGKGCASCTWHIIAQIGCKALAQSPVWINGPFLLKERLAQTCFQTFLYFI